MDFNLTKKQKEDMIYTTQQIYTNYKIYLDDCINALKILLNNNVINNDEYDYARYLLLFGGLE